MLIETDCSCGNTIKIDTLAKQKYGTEYSNLILFDSGEVSVFCSKCGGVVTLDNEDEQTVKIKIESIEYGEDFGLRRTHEKIQMHGLEIYNATVKELEKNEEIDTPLCLKSKLTDFLESYVKCINKYGLEAVNKVLEEDILCNY